MSVIGVDNLRVTHPCASDPEGPLDLHVLGMPPAFVLSQDQTLRCIQRFVRSCLAPITTDSNISLCLLRLESTFVSLIQAASRCQRTSPISARSGERDGKTTASRETVQVFVRIYF
jgi:hypothetical protein